MGCLLNLIGIAGLHALLSLFLKALGHSTGLDRVAVDGHFVEIKAVVFEAELMSAGLEDRTFENRVIEFRIAGRVGQSTGHADARTWPGCTQRVQLGKLDRPAFLNGVGGEICLDLLAVVLDLDLVNLVASDDGVDRGLAIQFRQRFFAELLHVLAEFDRDPLASLRRLGFAFFIIVIVLVIILIVIIRRLRFHALFQRRNAPSSRPCCRCRHRKTWGPCRP